MKPVFVVLVITVIVMLLSCRAIGKPVHKFRIGCFNIENFGEKKGEHETVMEILAKVVKRYDLLYIEEVAEKPDDECGRLTTKAICNLLQKSGVKRNLEMSPRLTQSGNGPEQYALLYDPKQFELLSSWVVNDSATKEPAYDKFMRPPMVTMLRSRHTNKVFAAGVCHTKPEEAWDELVNLAHELVHLEKRASPLSLICGDFNTKKNNHHRWAEYYAALPDNGTAYGMEIPNGVATGVLSGATLDRIITTPAMHAAVTSAQAFWFNDTEQGGFSMQKIYDEGCEPYQQECDPVTAARIISDHFPVEATIRFVFDPEP